jgi:methylisocitrate lyase
MGIRSAVQFGKSILFSYKDATIHVFSFRGRSSLSCGMTSNQNPTPREPVSAGARFRAALEAEHPLQMVGAITAYAARMAQATGFRALYLSGGGVAANSLGMPDLGISTMDDVLIDIRRITDATTLPLLVDADTGWGGAFNIARTVRSFTKAGAAGLHIEDQVAAKRCGHRPGKEIVSRDEMVDRVKAAVDARTDEAFVIMARTDSLAVEGLDLAIERALACVEAGADMIFPEAMTELSMYRRFKDAVKVPILANITEFGQTPLYRRDELASVGVDIVLYCCSAYRAMNAAALKTYEAIRRDGTQKGVLDIMQTRADLYKYLDYHRYERALDELFGGK